MPVEVVDERDAIAGEPFSPRGAGDDASVHDTTGTGALGHAPDDLVTAAHDAASAILDCLSRSDDELCVMLVGDERMRELNRDWRGKDASTDVLSFSQLEGDAMASTTVMLGDVVVSVDTMLRQAADGGWTAREELLRLLLHGVLHLLGHDHERDEDARVMSAEEARLVAALAARGFACAWEDETA